MNRIERRPIVLTFVAVLVAATLAAAETLTPHNVARLKTVAAVAVAPDGQSVAYVLSVPRTPLVEEDGGPRAELHLARRDAPARLLVGGDPGVAAVAWTPDGRSLSFLARRPGDAARSLYLLPIDGGEARRVLTAEHDITAYAWSPDGTRVAYLSRDPLPKARKDVEGKGFTQRVYEESVPFVRVWVAGVGEGAAPAKMLDLPGSASQLSWSPVGTRLAVALAPTPLVDDDLMMRRVHVVDADSGAVVAKLANPGKLGPLAWSPDGTHVALVSGEDINDPAAGRLLVAPAAGGELVDVLPGYLGHVSAIAWKDANTVAFVGDEGVETTLNEVGRDGRNRRVVVPGGGQVLASIDLSADGRTAAFVADSPAHPAEVFLMAATDKAPVRLTDSNPWLKDLRLAKQEVVKFKARDGLELEGLLVRPLDERPGTRYPLILTVHGGPEAHDRNGFRTGYSQPGQIAAARGFAVFYPNYRGSTGRGVAFSKLGQGDPAGKEFDDLVDAVDHLVAMGLVDRSKVGITGGSYGGYASAWGASYYSERFAAAVMFVGISSNLSRVGTTDIPNEEYLVHAMQRPWDDWTKMLETSPIYHAGTSKTPTLILHGTDDPRVHPSQSLDFYRHLKLRGQAPVRLVWYPGEGHGNRRAASRLDYTLRLLQWMEHYLKGPGGEPPAYDIDYAEPTTPPPTTTSVSR